MSGDPSLFGRESGRGVSVRGLTRTFLNGSSPVTALQAVSLDVPQGEIVGVLGENGAGKTTLVKVLATLLLPTSGHARVAGWDVVRDASMVRRSIAVIFGSDKGLHSRMTARQNIRYLSMLRGVPRRGLGAKCDEALRRVGLADRADDAVETFSKGMRQRLHLAIGLITTPEVLLLDEPTVGLDPVEAERVRGTLRSVAESGVAVLLTSHQLLDIERLAKRVVLLRRGQKIEDTTLREFMQRAGQVASVGLGGPGSPPEILVRMAKDSTGADDLVVHLASSDTHWETEIVVRRWSSSALGRLAAIGDGRGIGDIDLKPVSLDDVYRSFSTTSDQN